MALRFLVVDDNSAHQRLMANVIMFLGGKSDMASSGAEALEIVTREDFDIILMDLWMPDMDGAQVTARLLDRYQDDATRPRILAVTGLDTPERRALCRAVGMDGFVAKPFEVRGLKLLLQQVVTRGHCWQEGPSERLLSLDAMFHAVPKGDPQQAEKFANLAARAREQLRELEEGTQDLMAHAEALEGFARTYGFVRLQHTVESLAQAERSGESARAPGLWAEERRNFDTAMAAAREAFFGESRGISVGDAELRAGNRAGAGEGADWKRSG